jgi:hypothetical protein
MDIFKWLKPPPWTQEQTEKVSALVEVINEAWLVGITRPEIERLTQKFVEVNPEMIRYRTSIY